SRSNREMKSAASNCVRALSSYTRTITGEGRLRASGLTCLAATALRSSTVGDGAMKGIFTLAQPASPSDSPTPASASKVGASARERTDRGRALAAWSVRMPDEGEVTMDGAFENKGRYRRAAVT